MSVTVGRQKHLWIQAVCADRRLSGDAVRILVYCADRYVLSGETSFSIKQETVAANLGFRKRQTIGDAFHRGCDLGWLVKYERTHGRGWRVGDTYALTFPADKPPTPKCESSAQEIGPSLWTYSEGSAKGSSDNEYVRSHGEISPPSRQNRSVAAAEIDPWPRHENRSTPAETPDLNDVHEWCSTDELEAHGVTREDEPDHMLNFSGLFGFDNERNGNGHRTLPTSVIIGAEIAGAFTERAGSLHSIGSLTAETTMLVDEEAHKAGLLAALEASTYWTTS